MFDFKIKPIFGKQSRQFAIGSTPFAIGQIVLTGFVGA